LALSSAFAILAQKFAEQETFHYAAGVAVEKKGSISLNSRYIYCIETFGFNGHKTCDSQQYS
jgi:hypothetical protein